MSRHRAGADPITTPRISQNATEIRVRLDGWSVKFIIRKPSSAAKPANPIATSRLASFAAVIRAPTVMAVIDVYGASTADNASVVQWADLAGANRRWQLADAGVGGRWPSCRSRPC